MDLKNLEILSQKISPAELKNKEFKKTMMGYSPQEVVAFLDATAKAWEKVQKREKELTDKVKALTDEVLRLKGREGELNQLKLKAQEEAEEIKKTAQQEGQKILEEVKAKAGEIKIQTE